MYKSVKKWANIPFTIKPFIKYDGAGDKEYDDDVPATCYVEGKVINVIDKEGNEVTSNLQLYVDASIVLKVTDAIIYDNEEYVIKAIGTFYLNGNKDLLVVYL
jgi:hypothetical protein